MLRPIAIIQKKDWFGLGYKPDRRKRHRFVEEKRQNIIASFFGKEKESSKMDIPALSFSFLSTSFINPKIIQGNEEKVMVDIAETFGSLSIDMVEVEDQKAKEAGLSRFSRGQNLNNWTSINSLLSLNSKTSNDHEQPDTFAQEHSGFLLLYGIFS